VSDEDRVRWDRAHCERADWPPLSPAPFLVDNAALLVPGTTLDLAAGSGRNALFLASRGHRVVAADISAAALRGLRPRAPAIDAVQVDLDRPCFASGGFDNVVCINFLDRRLFAEIFSWLRPGGVLLLDTFLIDQRTVGHPRNPAFLLEHGELLERMRGQRVLRHREGAVEDDSGTSFRGGIVAKLTSPSAPA
jgi:tellurite methyltransferase